MVLFSYLTVTRVSKVTSGTETGLQIENWIWSKGTVDTQLRLGKDNEKNCVASDG
jgi:hypothetical protein